MIAKILVCGMRPLRVQKATNWHEPFQPEKLRGSLVRAGATDRLATEVLANVLAHLPRQVASAEVAQRAALALDHRDAAIAARYRLRQAMLELGPEGYPFERYVAKIFAHEGYETQVGRRVPGRCITHEVDVVAERFHQRLMIECKYHNRRGVQSDVKVAMYTWARFADIRDRGAAEPGSGHEFHQGWLVTNTKCTANAITYAQCVGLKILAWGYPPEASLQQRIEAGGLYPVTCLPNLTAAERRALLQHDLLLCRDLVKGRRELEQLGFSTAAATQLILRARQVVGA